MSKAVERTLANWPGAAGRKPNKNIFKTVEKQGLARPGTKAAVAVAMALREQGTTQEQVKLATGVTHRNKFRALQEQGLVQRVPAPSQGGLTTYKLVPKDQPAAS